MDPTISNNEIEDLELFLENCAIGVHLVSEDGTILWANQSELNFLGYAKDDYFGKSITLFHKDPDVIDKILKLLKQGKPLHTYPARLKAHDGTIKYVLINSNVFNKNGSFVHTRCFTTGISEIVYNQLREEM